MAEPQGASQDSWPRVYQQPLQLPLSVFLVLFGAQVVWSMGRIVLEGGDGLWLIPVLLLLPGLLLYLFMKVYQHVTLDRDLVEFRSRLSRVRMTPGEIIAIENDRIGRPSVRHDGGRLILGIGGEQLQSFLRDVKKMNPAIRLGPPRTDEASR